MQLETIIYGTQRISYRVLPGTRKSLAIEVYPDSSVVVRSPLGASRDEVHGKVSRRARWIVKQLQYFRQFEPRTPPRCFVSGETHLYLGKQYRLKVVSAEQETVKLLKGCFLVAVQGTPDAERTKTLLQAWYAEKASSTFQAGFERCWPSFEAMGYTQPRLLIRRMKTRWGSLSTAGNLTLNADLIRAPRECIEYVITHELCHLHYRDHNAAFYQLLETLLPDWQQRKHKLELALA